jgi:NAD(P)-dependent dehydrogenase (short-subunit alcohol dehydrogenase family)
MRYRSQVKRTTHSKIRFLTAVLKAPLFLLGLLQVGPYEWRRSESNGMTRILEGKSVLVTGAAGGIGSAAASLFAREGARLIVADLDVDGISRLVETIRGENGIAVGIQADLTDRDAAKSMVRAAVDAFGRLDGAFNNGGVTGSQVGMGGRLLADWSEEAFDQIIAVNLRGTFLCMREQIRQMLTQESGAIVNTASLGGLTGVRTNSGYAASKHGILGLTRSAAIEYAPTIRINAICPGYIDTNMLKDTMSRRGEQILEKIPFGRLAEPTEIAEMALWLLSDRASYATGHAFTVDGGYMAG